MQLSSLNPLYNGACQRLSAGTVRLAQQYLAGNFRSRLKPFQEQYASMGPYSFQERAAAPVTVATHAPLEINPEELLAGSAPCLEAVKHTIPGLGNSSISHTTVDFGNAMRLGLKGLENEIRQRMAAGTAASEREFCEALLEVIRAFRIWIERYREAYRKMLAQESYTDAQKNNFRRILTRLEQVPENPPRNFPEAIQALWSFFEFQRLNGNWSGLGRLDIILGGYLKADLDAGTITLDEARELLAHFWIKGTEWSHGLVEGSPFSPDSGDAQHYQNVILGGITPEGSIIENEVTYLVLDIVEELHISDYPVAVRISSRTSDKLLQRIAQVQLLGGGIVSVYNEEVVMRGLTELGFPENEVRSFTNDGCWEAIIPGKTNFGYHPFDILQPFQRALFADKTPESFQELYDNYLAELHKTLLNTRQDIVDFFGAHKRRWYGTDVTLSLMEPNCRRTARSYQDFGTEYTVRAIHAGGVPDVANSLRAIQEFVFTRHEITLKELVEILRQNWEGHETLRRRFHDTILYYGNDNADADAMVRKVHGDFARMVRELPPVDKVMTPPGISTFGREIEFAAKRMATAFGTRAGEYLAPNLSPTPGTDKSPLTSIVNSYCSLPLHNTPNGCPLDVRLSNGIRKLPDADKLLAGILRAFVKQGGWYLQIDVVDAEVLRDAQKTPDKYPNLVVRISGWSARFATLDKQWQDMIINRSSSCL